MKIKVSAFFAALIILISFSFISCNSKTVSEKGTQTEIAEKSAKQKKTISKKATEQEKKEEAEQTEQENGQTSDRSSSTSSPATSAPTTQQTPSSSGIKQVSCQVITQTADLKLPDISARQLAVNYMTRMATEVKWTPVNKIHTKNSVVDLWYYPGTVYTGIPYINTNEQNSDSSLERFVSFLTYDSSKEIYKYPDATVFENTYGNDCSSAVILSWKNVDPDVTAVNTHSFFPITTVGNVNHVYTIGDLNFKSYTKTKDIIANSSVSELYAAYASTQPGDALITHDSSGHMRMIVKSPVVTRKDGTIDPDSSKLITTEQTNQFDGKKNTTWWVEHSYTFAALKKTGYVPVTCKGINKTLEKPYVKIKNPNTDMTSKTFSGIVESNYAINKLNLSIKDENGNEHFSKSIFKSAFSIDISSYKIPELPAGTYYYSVTCVTYCGVQEAYCLKFTLK